MRGAEVQFQSFHRDYFYMKEIIVKSGKYGLKTIVVDDEDFESLSKHKWYAHTRTGNNWYAKASIFTYKKQFGILMHRIIMGCVNGDGVVIDHIDGNGLNNQKSNLRICTFKQNCVNRKKSTIKAYSSKYLGVHCRKSTGRFIASMRIGTKTKYIGIFETEEEAAIARNKAIVIYHGEFASQNIIP